MPAEGSVEVIVNGRSHVVSAPINLEEILRICNATAPHVAVALNDAVVPRGQLAATIVREGDRIEIVRAVGGG